MRKWLVLTVLILGLGVLASGVVLPPRAEAYNQGVHQLMTKYARLLWWNDEILQYAGSIDEGAYHEDEVDHVWDYYGTDGECLTITHFWEPDRGIEDYMETVFCNGQNAAWKAMILWGMALGSYHTGDKAQAYEYLGHVAHLLGDLTVPAHAHDDSHVYPDTYDDEYMDTKRGCDDPPGPECVSADELNALIAAGPTSIPEGPLRKLYWLFYTTAQLTGFYASDDEFGNYYTPDDSVDFGGLEWSHECTDPGHVDAGDCDMSILRKNCYLRSIPAVAALYKLFAEEATQQAELTVAIDTVQQLEGHSDDPDYFVRVAIGDFWFRNEGKQVGDAGWDPINTGWAFAHNVGLTGSVQVKIELWDDDVGGYDHSDIYTDPDGEERSLWLTVDLAKCIAGEDGAITGDFVGKCGNQYTTEGDDSNRSRIWFRILAPNVAPTANAGPDQVANEGDTVALNGSFTDNADDTQTFLWHLESSTNGQTVPDSTAQSFSFTPSDNGVYTFKFTVTDNHGAKGSDTVVVTVQNVAPVVSALYVSNQPNTEFILPAVHSITFKGTFTDAGTADTHAAVWNWGDGTTSTGNVTETNGSGSVSREHTYSQPGDYTVTLAVTDDDSGSGSNTMTLHVAGAGEALNIFDAYIQSLPDNLFKNNAGQRKAALANMFGFLRQMLSVKNYRGMILSMNTNIRTKFDGLVGGKPNDDWIVENLAVQKELCQKVDDITSYLRYRQSASN